LLSKFFKLPDPRGYGSRNPGATNILRSGSKIIAFITLMLDILKGFITTAVAIYWFEDIIYAQIIGCITVFGHIYPLFYKFKGGKGVATALGAVLGFNLFLGLICLITWLMTALLFRYSALSAIVTFTFLPLYTWFSFESWTITSIYLALTLVVIYKHINNIKNLLNNEETKIGEKN
tara:strand:- start:5874 stop:6404 length:531 start_codon:yes stop_codon:yes gene_type:complete